MMLINKYMISYKQVIAKDINQNDLLMLKRLSLINGGLRRFSHNLYGLKFKNLIYKNIEDKIELLLNQKIYLAIDNFKGNIIGWSLVDDNELMLKGLKKPIIAVYVNSQYRKLGIGSKLVLLCVDQYKIDHNNIIYSFTDTEKSNRFFKKRNIPPLT